MYINVYIYIYIYICVYSIHTYIHTYMHTYMHTYIHAYIQTWMDGCIYAYEYVDTYMNELVASTPFEANDGGLQESRQSSGCGSRLRRLQPRRLRGVAVLVPLRCVQSCFKQGAILVFILYLDPYLYLHHVHLYLCKSVSTFISVSISTSISISKARSCALILLSSL